MRTSRVVIGTVESARASSSWLTTLKMPPGRVCTASPCDCSTALNARSHGWFLISAVTFPATPFPTMMLRPLKAANPATTSSMSAWSHCTVMRGACDWSASPRCAARYSSIVIGRPTVGVRTRAACADPPITAGAAAGGGVGEGGASATAERLDNAPNAVRSVPIRIRTWPAPRST